MSSDSTPPGRSTAATAAVRLSEVDRELAALTHRRETLLAERDGLLRTLDADVFLADPEQHQARPPDPEATPRSVQNTLLGVGGLLLGLAAVVFTAVTYDRLGAGGRSTVLLAFTVLAAGGAPLLLRRGLRASAEAVAGVALLLAALDVYGLHELGVGDTLALPDVWAAGGAALALLAAAYAWAVPVRLPARAAVVLAQLPPLLLIPHTGTLDGAALLLAGVAAADLLASRALPAAARDLRRTAAGCGVLAGLLGLLLALSTLAAGAGFVPSGARSLLAFAALSVAVSLRVPPGLRAALRAAAVVLVALATWALLRPRLELELQPLVAAAVALVAVLAAAVLPRPHRPGPVLGAAVVAAAGLLTQGRAVVEALVLPAGWLLDPWTRTESGAREALSPIGGWSGSAVALAVVGAAAVVVVAAGRLLDRLTAALPPAVVLGVTCAVLLPLALGVSYALALVLLLLTAGGLGLAALRVPSPSGRAALLAGAAAVVLLTTAWAAADETATLLVLPVAAALAALVAWRLANGPPAVVSAAAAGLLAGATLGSAGASAGLPTALVGAVLVPAVAVLLAVAAALSRATVLLGRPPRPALRAGVEIAAGALAVAALLLSARDAGALSWVLAGLGLLALAAALQPDRRRLAVAGALLLAASSWRRLAEAGVSAPEPYVIPLGLLALGLGHLRRREVPATTSSAAYGPGLSLLLLPSLLAALVDDDLTRPLLLGAAALAVLLIGARARLRAPLVAGAVVLAVDGLNLLLPYAQALPRWLPLALAGALLLGLGATYEQRRRDVATLRDRFSALG